MLPDTVAKVSLVRFEKVPAKAQDLDQLIRWQVRKAAPFRIEDAQVSWVPGVALAGGGREFVVTVARRDIDREYERACEAAGVHAGLVDLASFNLINAVLAGDAGAPRRLAAGARRRRTTPRSPSSATADLVFFRNRAAGGTGGSAPTSCIRRRCITRIGSAAAGSRASCSPARRAARAGRRPSGSGGSSKSASASQVEPLDFRAGGRDARSHHRRSGAARRAGAGAGVLLRERVVRRRPSPGRVSEGGVVLRTNLSTRPFYNERAVHLLLALAGVIVARSDGLQRRPHRRAVAPEHRAVARVERDRDGGGAPDA